jgi:hypothetical protein
MNYSERPRRATTSNLIADAPVASSRVIPSSSPLLMFDSFMSLFFPFYDRLAECWQQPAVLDGRTIEIWFLQCDARESKRSHRLRCA